MDADVAKEFVDRYYLAFDDNRSNLGVWYKEASMLTFGGEETQGSVNIVAKLTSLPFQQCKHVISTVDCQPSGPAGGMLALVDGTLQFDGEDHVHRFSQVFLVMPTATEGSYYVLNDIFRM